MKYLLSIHYLIWLIISATFFALGEFLSKKFALQPKFIYVIYILIVYSIETLTWLPAILAKNQLSVVGTIWSVLSLLMTVLIGLVVFGEKINCVEAAGIVVAFIAVFLLSLS